MEFSRRRILQAAAALPALGLPLPAFAQAAAYPDRPITIVLDPPAGSTPDVAARFYGERIKAATGQPLIPENRPGAGGALAAATVARAAPDGYTMLVGTSAIFSANRHLYRELPYDPDKDFRPVARMYRLAFALLVNPETTPVTSVAELTEFLKAKKEPISYGWFSTSMQALGAQYADQAGIAAEGVGYKGTGQIVTDLEGGLIDFSFADAARALKPGPKLRPLAVTLESRAAALPDLPTMAEAGMKDFLPLYSWFSIHMPAATPDDIVTRMEKLILDITALPETEAFLRNVAGEPFPAGAEELATFQLEFGKSWERFVEIAGIKPQ